MSQGLRNKITIYRFVLIIFVISIHTWNLSVYEITRGESAFGDLIWFIESYSNSIEGACVPFFFAISGYLFFRDFDLNKLPYKWKKRVRTVALPYLIWASLYYFYYVVVSRLGIISIDPISTDAVTYLRWLWSDSYFVLWYLKGLLIAIAFAPVIYIVLYNKFFGAMVCVVLVTPIVSFIPEWFVLPNFFFVVGAYAGIHLRKQTEGVFSRHFVIACRSVLLMLFVYNGFVVISERSLGKLSILAFIIALWGSISYEFFEKIKLPWWMETTMFIYCAHDVFLEGFEKILSWLFGKSYVVALMDYIFMPVFVAFVVIVIAGIMQQLTPRVYRVLTGDR